MSKQSQQRKTLKERYDEKFLDEAERRREALQYKRLHVGQINNDRLEHLVRLLYQTHQNYYLGYFEASCVLAGSMLEQSLLILLEDKLIEDGYVSVKRIDDSNNISSRKIKSVDELSQCNIGLLVSAVHSYGMLDSNKFSLAKILQTARNCAAHDMLPEFLISGINYEAVFDKNVFEGKRYKEFRDKNTVGVEIDEINKYTVGRSSRELWAYFLLTRTRELIEYLFIERVKKFPPDFVV